MAVYGKVVAHGLPAIQAAENIPVPPQFSSLSWLSSQSPQELSASVPVAVWRAQLPSRSWLPTVPGVALQFSSVLFNLHELSVASAVQSRSGGAGPPLAETESLTTTKKMPAPKLLTMNFLRELFGSCMEVG